MTAAASSVPSGGDPASSWADATPAEVRAVLSPESAVEFDRQWRGALAAAAEAYDLATVHACLDAWRRVARVTAVAGGAEGYRRLLDRAGDALERSGPPRAGASWSEVRAELGLQVPYRVDVDTVHAELEALPHLALVALAEVVAVLEVSPWAGDPLVGRNPHGAVRTMPFGEAGLLTYVIVEHADRVDLLQVHWAS